MVKLKSFLLVGIIFLGFLLRFHHYDQCPRHGATFDEFAWTWQGMSLWQTGIPTSWSPHPQYKNFQIKNFQGALVRLVTPYLEHPPLFGLIAGGFALITGSKQLFDIALGQIRVLALVLGTTSIWLVFLVAKKLYGVIIGLLSAMLYATAPTIVIGSRIVQNENFFIPVFLIIWLIILNYLESQKPWQRNLAAVLAGLLTLAKIPWAAATVALCLLMASKKRFKDMLIIGAIALSIFSLYFIYGAVYDWSTFINLWGLQTARAKIGLGNTLALFTHPYLLDRLYPDGWLYWGWLSLAILSTKFKKHSLLLIPVIAYFLVFILAIPGIEAQGWYRYPFYPFLMIAGAAVLEKIIKKPSLLNLAFFFLIAATAWHWGWEEIFGMPNWLFRAIVLLGFASFLPTLWWPEKFPRLARRATHFWLVIFILLNIASVVAHVHS